MRCTAVIELPSTADSELPEALIEAAYRASQSGPVVFVLSAAQRATVDRLLDPIVARIGLTAHGVRYLGPTDRTTVTQALASCACVVATSPGFRAQCLELGLSPVGLAEASARLGAWVTPPSGAPAPSLASP